MSESQSCPETSAHIREAEPAKQQGGRGDVLQEVSCDQDGSVKPDGLGAMTPTPLSQFRPAEPQYRRSLFRR